MEVDCGEFSFEEVGEDGCCGRGEEDSVAIVACGYPLARGVGETAEEGECVGGAGAKAGPGFHLRGSLGGSESGEEGGSASSEKVEVGGVDAQVEAGVFIGGSDEGCAGLGTLGAGDDVNRLTAVHLVEREDGGKADSQHLAFARFYDRGRALEPGAGGMHQLPGEEGRAVERAHMDAIG